MSSVAEIEEAVQQLRPDELARFREWFAAYDAAQWNRAIEDDARAGRLDALAGTAIRDAHDRGCKQV